MHLPLQCSSNQHWENWLKVCLVPSFWARMYMKIWRLMSILNYRGKFEGKAQIPCVKWNHSNKKSSNVVDFFKKIPLYIPDIDECENVICQNNGTCIDGINGYSCNCTDGYDGQHCDNSKYCMNVNTYTCVCVASCAVYWSVQFVTGEIFQIFASMSDGLCVFVTVEIFQIFASMLVGYVCVCVCVCL